MADFSSSNPFRRKGPTAQSQPTTNPSYHPPAPIHLETRSLDAPKKITKKVRVQSPPPLSPDIDSASTIGEEKYRNPVRLPSPIPRDHDPFDSTVSDTSEDELDVRPKGVPANPFSKTLETMERAERAEAPAAATPNVANPGKPPLDVDAFKRLLMTGNAGLGPSTTAIMPQAQVAQHALGSGDSSTDTSSLSRQSIFEAAQEAHLESPRTSHEIEEPEEYRRGLAPAGRKKPPPPSSRHGKLIKVELRDEQLPLQSPPPSGSSQQFSPSLTDLNKPLPPSPRRPSHESDRESIFDKEAAGKTPEPRSPSPTPSLRKKTPPVPPLQRRHSQMVPESKMARSDSKRLSPQAEEESIEDDTIGVRLNSARSRSDSLKIPPPPPSRRPGTGRASSTSQALPSQPSPIASVLTSPSSASLPPLPPARGSSRSISGGSKPSSVLNMDISSTPAKRTSMLPPPPPPPHRHGRKNSSEAQGQSPGTSRRTSGDYPRKSLDSMRRESIDIPEVEEGEKGVKGETKPDILADLSRLQREIDELRVQGERRVS